MFEPVNPGWSTPSWGEFGAWRVQGRHVGLDYYVSPGTPLFASGDGTVEVVSFHSGGHGHFITIRYAAYRVSVSHMLSRSPLSPGDKVTRLTRIGTVGQTGNAEGIAWNGLIHPHVEVRRLNSTYIESPRQILKPFNRSALSGGDGTPITQPGRRKNRMASLFTTTIDGQRRAALVGLNPGTESNVLEMSNTASIEAAIRQFGEPIELAGSTWDRRLSEWRAAPAVPVGAATVNVSVDNEALAAAIRRAIIRD